MNYIKIPAFLRGWLFTLLGLFSFTSLQSQCEASYVFGFVDEHTAVFFNNSANYNGQEWEMEDGTSLSDGPAIMTYTFDSDTNRVCLRVWTDDGCEDVQCLNVYPGAPEEMCNNTDCVWPGDANDDFKANIYDVLSIGMGFGQSGPERPFFPDPENPIAWAANFASNWGGSTGTVNDKHLDCDGNGIIDENDLDAIELNYQADFDYSATPTNGAPLAKFDFQEDTIYYYNVQDQENFEIKANLTLGTEDVSFDDLYGLAFDVTYPGDLVEEEAVSFEYNAENFLGTVEEVINFGHDLNSIGRFDLAISRTDGFGVEGNGSSGTITFIVNSDIIDGLFEPQIPFRLLIERFKAIDAEGNELDFDLELEGTEMIIIRDIIAEEEPKLNIGNQFKVYPNPVADQMIIDLGKAEGNTIELFNLVGHAVKQKRMKGSVDTLDVEDLPPGVYFLRIETPDGTLTKQIHVE